MVVGDTDVTAFSFSDHHAMLCTCGNRGFKAFDLAKAKRLCVFGRMRLVIRGASTFIHVFCMAKVHVSIRRGITTLSRNLA